SGRRERAMPFTFKLSQRLARIRSAALLLATAALAACEKPIGLTDPAGTLSRLVVSPKVLTLRPNQTADFMAVGLTSTGDTATVAVDWSASGGRITAMSTIGGRHYGHYTATADTGTVKVVAKGNHGAADGCAAGRQWESAQRTHGDVGDEQRRNGHGVGERTRNGRCSGRRDDHGDERREERHGDGDGDGSGRPGGFRCGEPGDPKP